MSRARILRANGEQSKFPISPLFRPTCSRRHRRGKRLAQSPIQAISADHGICCRGLLRCGGCGAGTSSNGKDKSRRIRIRCSAATESGTCPDPKTFYLDTVETAVLNRLTAELRHPEVIAHYVQTYQKERRRLAAETDARRTRLEPRLGEISREIERLVNAIAQRRSMKSASALWLSWIRRPRRPA
ncbi:zinc ribbon domain-containing protein [Mesorhizobium sp. M0751]|uniref:zinc ribbon domain-containing protein n=1 Tax=unclassified Mesorhizobium TaxID=325217 RepID=UPI003334CEE8